MLYHLIHIPSPFWFRNFSKSPPIYAWASLDYDSCTAGMIGMERLTCTTKLSFYWLLVNFLPGLALNLDPSNLCLLKMSLVSHHDWWQTFLYLTNPLKFISSFLSFLWLCVCWTEGTVAECVDTEGSLTAHHTTAAARMGAESRPCVLPFIAFRS
jgi:hypothetical protein